MATTPEGKIKKKIKEILESHKPALYYYMPVPGGFGKPTVDYLGIYYGSGFAIEAKRPGKKPTERQAQTLSDVESAGGAAFVINDEASLARFVVWLNWIKAERHG